MRKAQRFTSDPADYWRQLDSACTATELWERLSANPEMEKLKNEDGANPVLIAIHKYPKFLRPKTRRDWTHQERELLSGTDNNGRDLWYYVLTSTGDDSLFWETTGRTSGGISSLLRAYPPKTDIENKGWLDWLLLQPFETIEGINHGGSKLLTLMGGIPELQTVLKVGSSENQEVLVKHTLLAGKTRWGLGGYLKLASHLLRIMSPITYSEATPELRCLACLGAVIYGSGSCESAHNGKVDTFEERKAACLEMQELALDGLHFCRGGEFEVFDVPWGHGMKEWDILHGYLKDHEMDSELADIEAGWKHHILDNAASDPLDKYRCELPRL